MKRPFKEPQSGRRSVLASLQCISVARFAVDSPGGSPAPDIFLASRVADVDDESSYRNLLHLSNRIAAKSSPSPSEAASPTPAASPARSPTPAAQVRGVELCFLGDRAV